LPLKISLNFSNLATLILVETGNIKFYEKVKTVKLAVKLHTKYSRSFVKYFFKKTSIKMDAFSKLKYIEGSKPGVSV
jgi:hypothetical protein